MWEKLLGRTGKADITSASKASKDGNLSIGFARRSYPWVELFLALIPLPHKNVRS
jgi:hypothetical protein